jgi:kynurenine formamidase
MGRFLDLSVTVDSSTMSPPSTSMRREVTPHHRGTGFWQVSSVHQSLDTGAHIDSPLHSTGSRARRARPRASSPPARQR